MNKSLMPPVLAMALSASFGSVEQWLADLLNQATQAPQHGVTLALSLTKGRLVNRSTPSGGSMATPAGVLTEQNVPILALMPASKPPAELDASSLLDGVDWAACLDRYKQAVEHASSALGIDATACSGALFVDVRRAPVFDAAPSCISGAHRRDPADVEAWALEPWADGALVVYCVYGHEVGQGVALRLQAKGVNARFLIGGIEGWQAAGLPLQHKGQIKEVQL